MNDAYHSNTPTNNFQLGSQLLEGYQPLPINIHAQAESIATKTVTGFINGGNTCFMNVLFDLLAASPSLRNHVEQKSAPTSGIGRALTDMFKAKWANSPPATLEALKAVWQYVDNLAANTADTSQPPASFFKRANPRMQDPAEWLSFLWKSPGIFEQVLSASIGCISNGEVGEHCTVACRIQI